MSSMSVSSKLFAVFMLQLVLTTAALIGGIAIANHLLETQLIGDALEREIAHVKAFPDTPTVELATIATFRNGDIPSEVAGLSDGLHDVIWQGREQLIRLETVGGDRVAVAFEKERVLENSWYLVAIPAILMLLIIYAASYITYRFSAHSVRPIVSLAQDVREIDLKNVDSNVFARHTRHRLGSEVVDLATALTGLAQNMDELVGRERDFTRDASHELRTPLTVVQMAADMLLDDDSIDNFQRRNLQRVHSATREMQNMLEALLVLARTDSSNMPVRWFSVNDVVDTELERSSFLANHDDIRITLDERVELRTEGIPTALSLIVTHTMRRVCCSIRQGDVCILIDDGVVVMDATGQPLDTEMDPTTATIKSPGETIIGRLSNRFNCPIAIYETDDQRVRAVLNFDNWRIEPLTDEQPVVPSAASIG